VSRSRKLSHPERKYKRGGSPAPHAKFQRRKNDGRKVTVFTLRGMPCGTDTFSLRDLLNYGITALQRF
jgi:hypothetical protein